ncbi:MAG TPA: acyl-CoA dehydrogenase family protein, partial [Cystobacter sp.]
MNFEPSARSQEYLERVKRFVREHIEPAEGRIAAQLQGDQVGGDWRRWRVPPQMEEWKAKARAEGLWNLFLPDAKLGAGLSTLEYAPIAQEMGRSLLAPEVFNCNAPDTGNMEVLWRYGSEEQKKQWLEPLLAGEIRSVFCMTEPEVASSDATNMQATAVLDGDHVVLNGRKWWSSGLGHPKAKIAIFMARTPAPDQDRHHQHSMVLVPLDTPGVTVERMLPVFGEYDISHGGHGEVRFENVRFG